MQSVAYTPDQFGQPAVSMQESEQNQDFFNYQPNQPDQQQQHQPRATNQSSLAAQEVIDISSELIQSVISRTSVNTAATPNGRVFPQFKINTEALDLIMDLNKNQPTEKDINLIHWNANKTLYSLLDSIEPGKWLPEAFISPPADPIDVDDPKSQIDPLQEQALQALGGWENMHKAPSTSLNSEVRGKQPTGVQRLALRYLPRNLFDRRACNKILGPGVYRNPNCRFSKPDFSESRCLTNETTKGGGQHPESSTSMIQDSDKYTPMMGKTAQLIKRHIASMQNFCRQDIKRGTHDKKNPAVDLSKKDTALNIFIDLQHVRQFENQLYGRSSLAALSDISRRQLIEYTFTHDLPINRVTRHFWPAFHFCLQKSLLPSQRTCSKCKDQQMQLVKQRAGYMDGAYWRCNRCYRSMSIRQETMFNNCKITIMETMRIAFHYFVRNYNAIQATIELKEVTGIMSYRTVSFIYKIVRNQVHIWMQNYYRTNKIGRYGRAIEIDESIFASSGKDGTKVWVLGFFERGSQEKRAIHVKDRTQETLTQVILETVEPGAEVWTDFWRGYNGLKNFYTHRVVNKAQKGSGQGEYMTTNRVESMWAWIKHFFGACGYHNTAFLQKFLDEAIWRMKFKSFPERIDFLLQINSYHNYMGADSGYLAQRQSDVGRNGINTCGNKLDQKKKYAQYDGFFSGAQHQYENEFMTIENSFSANFATQASTAAHSQSSQNHSQNNSNNNNYRRPVADQYINASNAHHSAGQADKFARYPNNQPPSITQQNNNLMIDLSDASELNANPNAGIYQQAPGSRNANAPQSVIQLGGGYGQLEGYVDPCAIEIVEDDDHNPTPSKFSDNSDNLKMKNARKGRSGNNQQNIRQKQAAGAAKRDCSSSMMVNGKIQKGALEEGMEIEDDDELTEMMNMAKTGLGQDCELDEDEVVNNKDIF